MSFYCFPQNNTPSCNFLLKTSWKLYDMVVCSNFASFNQIDEFFMVFYKITHWQATFSSKAKKTRKTWYFVRTLLVLTKSTSFHGSLLNEVEGVLLMRTPTQAFFLLRSSLSGWVSSASLGIYFPDWFTIPKNRRSLCISVGSVMCLSSCSDRFAPYTMMSSIWPNRWVFKVFQKIRHFLQLFATFCWKVSEYTKTG